MENIRFKKMIDKANCSTVIIGKNDGWKDEVNLGKVNKTAIVIADEYMVQISELSEIIHVCDDRLIRLFKEVTGETPIEYIMNLRIEAAIKLLSTTDLSVADVAEKVGFGSDTYMTRVFKQKLNTTPGKYRHKHKKD